EVNCNKGGLEGSLIMAQTALELLYNWLIVENKKLILGEDAKKISAASKLRLLVSQLSIKDKSVPSEFSSLEEYRRTYSCIDVIEAVVQIRNAIIHFQQKKRKKLDKISVKTLSEAVQLCLWYIELSILYSLKFKDEYSSRCS